MRKQFGAWSWAVAVTCMGCSSSPPPARAPEPWPAVAHVAAVVPANGITLAPFVEDGTTVVVPIPPDRSGLLRLDISVTVTQHGGGRVVLTRHGVVGRYTEGEALRFTVPMLEEGKYDVEIHAVTFHDTMPAGGGPVTVTRSEDTAYLAVVGTERATTACVESELRFRFIKGTAQLVDADFQALEATVDRARRLVTARTIERAQADCWASSDGDEAMNLALSQRRCAWVRNQVWARLPAGKPALLEAAHGENNPPHAEPTTAEERALEAARQENRVVVLRVCAREAKRGPATP